MTRYELQRAADKTFIQWNKDEPKKFRSFKNWETKQREKLLREINLLYLIEEDDDNDNVEHCNLYETNPPMCQICMIESCHVNAKYASDRWSDSD